jgi:dTDP-4-amino-4,6-dideoxygalactose transaminase
MKAKADLAELALCGGPPLFDRPRPIGQLAAPPLADFLAALKREPLERQVQALEAELADYHRVPHVVAIANAALGLMLLMRLLADGRNGEFVIPAFSYRGLPHFARWAGLQPRFCDVEAERHTLCPAALVGVIGPQTRGVLGVANFNSPGRLDRLQAVCDAAGVPLILDSVYALGCSWRGQRLGGFGLAEVYSLHATKLLNGFEGGYICTLDAALAARLRGLREGVGAPPALRAVLQPLHALMARLSLRELDDTLARNRDRDRAYRHALAGLPGLRLIEAEAGEQSSYQMVVAELAPPWPLSRDQTVALLRAEGAAISAYYSPALHRSEHVPSGPVLPECPVAERLADRLLQLPVGEHVSLADIAAISALLRLISEQGEALVLRLQGSP